jgi:hypothetical protein
VAAHKKGIAWMWEDYYQEWRNIASVILDVMGLNLSTFVWY